jgi:imidazolonepropionase-like amidohydrolase
MKHIIGSLILFVSVFGYAQQSGNILIRNGTVITITGGTLTETDVLVTQGKISQIGKNIAAPTGTEVVDATGMYVMPGIVDAHSHIAIDAVNEGTNPVTAEVAVGDAVDPYDISIYRALAGGVTISHAMHGSANVIGGQCQTIKHRWGVEEPQMYKMQGAPRTIKFALGENPMRVHGEGRGIVPRTRMGVEQVLRATFSEAVQYKEKWTAYRKLKDSGLAAPPEYDLRMETIGDIIDGEILVHCHAYRADEMLMLMRVLGDFGVNNICFQHANEGFKIAPELAAFGATASVFADWWAYKFEVYYSTAYNASILTRNGVVTSINSDSGELIRHLYHEAAKTQKYGGLNDDEALSLITINPAKQLGINQSVGSIEVGKDGDLAIFNHHPLSIYAVAQKTIVDGIVRFDIEADADDIRISVDPEETIPAFFESRQEENGCMQDTEFSSHHVHH